MNDVNVFWGAFIAFSRRKERKIISHSRRKCRNTNIHHHLRTDSIKAYFYVYSTLQVFLNIYSARITNLLPGYLMSLEGTR